MNVIQALFIKYMRFGIGLPFFQSWQRNMNDHCRAESPHSLVQPLVGISYVNSRFRSHGTVQIEVLIRKIFSRKIAVIQRIDDKHIFSLTMDLIPFSLSS